MKKSIFSFLWAIILLSSTSVFAQEITEKDKEDQEKRLKENPRDFAANFVVGAYYYNLASEPHEETTKMKVIQYIEEGQPYEKKKEAYLKKALPYFENCYALQKDERVKAALKNIYQHLGVLPRFRATPKEVETRLQEKLRTLEFKEIN